MRPLLVLLLAAACGRERSSPEETDCPAWQPEVAPLLAERCASCHEDLREYAGVLARATAGDPASPLLRVLGDPDHAGLADTGELLGRWVVDCRLAYRDSRLHEGGLMNPADPDFHGALVRDGDWDLAVCQACHGDDFAGGTAQASCNGCHVGTPASCTTCHAQPGGSHPAHQDACSECHVVPARWDAPGHMVGDTPPAEVVFGALAARDLDPPRRTAPPAYDPASQTCSAVYCHGGVLAESTEPRWGGEAQTCGSCHGAPPADHVSPMPCASCHPAELHLDGKIDVGTGTGCNACHDVGADPPHRAHLVAGKLRGPIPCNECHVVPASVDSPGHLDATAGAEVFPPGSGVLARFGGAMPSWNGTSCADVYCHGPASPTWTALDQGEAACGTCHGVPPDDVAHASRPGLGECASCHPGVSDSGGILVPGVHLDGVVDVHP